LDNQGRRAKEPKNSVEHKKANTIHKRRNNEE
jgi:hypothetical protein